MAYEAEFGGEALERAILLLNGVPNGVSRAVHSALPRAASHVRKESVPYIQKRYAIKAKTIREYNDTTDRYNLGVDKSEAGILFTGRRVPLMDFMGSSSPTIDIWDKRRKNPVFHHGRWSMLWPGKAAKGHQLKGTSPTKFETAFIGRMKNGHFGIFDKTGNMTSEGSDQIRELMGVSPPEMLDRDEVKEPLAKAAGDVFEQRLDHEVYRILNGWGGKK